MWSHNEGTMFKKARESMYNKEQAKADHISSIKALGSNQMSVGLQI